MKEIRIKSVILIFFLCIKIFPLFSDINDARDKYKSGDYTGALVLYDEWLRNNHNSENFTSVLFEVSELKGDLKDICRVLEPEITYIRDRQKKSLLYERLAQLYELSSNVHKAQGAYQNAALSILDKIDYKNLLKSAQLLLLEGDLLLAKSQLTEIITNSPVNSTSIKAKQYYEILEILNSRNVLNRNFSALENPSSQYLAYLIEMDDNKDKLKEKIIKDFSLSPEAGLLQKKILPLPNIFTSLGLLRTEKVSSSDQEKIAKGNPVTVHDYSIQTGSFKDPENARYLAVDIEKEGFSPIVEEQTVNNIKYYKVILYFSNERDMQKSLEKLKEMGFEGFPIY